MIILIGARDQTPNNYDRQRLFDFRTGSRRDDKGHKAYAAYQRA
jgi:hypothetical protein